MMRKLTLFISFFSALLLVPFFSYAAPGSLRELANTFVGVFNILIPVIFSLALLVFLWGVAQYVVFPGNEEKKSKGKSIMIWGIVAFFFMVSVWGVVNLVYSSVFRQYDPQSGSSAPYNLARAQEKCSVPNPPFGCGNHASIF